MMKMLDTLIGAIYVFVGHLLLKRDYYESRCSTCGWKTYAYFPEHGAFPWEWKYWQTYSPNHTCEGGVTIKKKPNFGLSGALYRLPGYKSWERVAWRLDLRDSHFSGRLDL